MTLVEFWPLSRIFSVIEAVDAADATEAADAAEFTEATEAAEAAEEVEGFEPPAPIVVTKVEVELFEPETEVTVKLFRAIKRARTANKWTLRCTY